MKGVFVTGTDTGVGKTFISCAITRGFTRLNQRVATFKPVAAGCEHIDGQWRNDDALALQHAAGNWQSYESINPFALPAAIAPHIAADECGVALSLEKISPYFQTLSADACVVEGAGGFLVPLNDRESFADLATALALPIVVVVAMRLGCINHALLTVRAIEARGLRVAGWVANQAQAEPMSRYQQNCDYLKSHIAAPLLAEWGWQEMSAEKDRQLAERILALV